MRWAEAILWMVPVIGLGVWWFGPRHLSRRVVAGAALLLILYIYLLYHLGSHRIVHGTYLPAHLVGGKIVGGP